MDYKRVWAEINLDNLAANFRAVRRFLPAATRLMASVKADGYGHGAVEVSKLLLFNGADALGVAICEEGVQLRTHHILAPILVMGFTPEPLLDEIVRHRLTQTIFCTETAHALAKAAARRDTRADVHIKIDTGMSRLGFLPNEASVDAICEIASLPSLSVTGIYTHLATSDARDNRFMYTQRERFLWMLEALAKRGLSIPTRHMANSGAFAQFLRSSASSINEGSTHKNDVNAEDVIQEGVNSSFFMDMARIGILLYGLLPSGEMAEACANMRLFPVMRLVTQVSMVKVLPAGAGVGYGHLFCTPRETVIATLPVGYADGYPRRLSNKAHVLIGGKSAPIIGAICMDQCMVDVTDLPTVKPGDEVVMLGAQDDAAITADELAAMVGTIGYEIVCGIGKRVPRVYIKNNEALKTLSMV